MVRAADGGVAVEAAAARVDHLAGGVRHEAHPRQPRRLQGGQGRADAVLGPQPGHPPRLPRHCADPGQVLHKNIIF